MIKSSFLLGSILPNFALWDQGGAQARRAAPLSGPAARLSLGAVIWICHLGLDSLARICPKNVGIHQVRACQLSPERTAYFTGIQPADKIRSGTAAVRIR
jgi:hypothetical protein